MVRACRQLHRLVRHVHRGQRVLRNIQRRIIIMWKQRKSDGTSRLSIDACLREVVCASGTPTFREHTPLQVSLQLSSAHQCEKQQFYLDSPQCLESYLDQASRESVDPGFRCLQHQSRVRRERRSCDRVWDYLRRLGEPRDESESVQVSGASIDIVRSE